MSNGQIEAFPDLTPEAKIVPATAAETERGLTDVDTRIWHYLKRTGGATADAVSYALSLDGRSTASARIRMMVRSGDVKDSGRREVTRANHTARVWEAIDRTEAAMRPTSGESR